MNSDFSKDYIIELVGLSPKVVGRVTIYKSPPYYNLEIDLIQADSGKIFKHVRSMYGELDHGDALNLAMHYLRDFFKHKKQ